MKYMGSKSRIKKYIVPIIQQYVDNCDSGIYYEPFCGGCNVIDSINAKYKYANDLQYYLIELFKNADKVSSLPDYIEKDLYDRVRSAYRRNLKTFPDWYIGAIGFFGSYNGRFFDGGYNGSYKKRNYFLESKNNFLNQKGDIRDVIFTNKDYKDIDIVPGSVVYCDPPYRNSKEYDNSHDFDMALFWDWCRRKSKRNVVIVSEMSAPDDFICIWSGKQKTSIKAIEHIDRTEKLFVYKDNIRDTSNEV